jgi:hypothetical protein
VPADRHGEDEGTTMATPARALTYEDGLEVGRREGMEAGRREIATATLIREIAEGSPGKWYSSMRFAELGDRTPTETWRAGDHRAVRDLIDKQYADSEATGRRMRSNPAIAELIEKRIAELQGASGTSR